MHVEPVVGQALQARDLVAHLVVENFGAAARNGIQPGIAQPPDRVFNRQPADLGYTDDLRRRKAVQMDLRKALLHPAEHRLVPLDFQVGMQAALQQHAGAAQLDRLAHLVVDGVEVEDVSLGGELALQRPIEGAEGAVLGAEVGVINVAVDDVGDHALGMQAAAHRVGLHTDADQVIGAKQLQRFSFGQGHRKIVAFYLILPAGEPTAASSQLPARSLVLVAVVSYQPSALSKTKTSVIPSAAERSRGTCSSFAPPPTLRNGVILSEATNLLSLAPP